MLPVLKRIVFVLVSAGVSFVPVDALDPRPVYGADSVVVVANRAMDGSLKVADAYMKMRGIPADHLIILETSTEEQVSRKEYLDTIHNPLMHALLQRELVDAFSGSIDLLGRKTATLFENKIRYMVLCYGIPSRVRATGAEQAAQDDPYLKRFLRRTNPGLIETFTEGNLARNDASVDGELSLLFKREIPLRGFVPNPLHNNENNGGFEDILRVTRLDGPSPEAVIRMLESSLAGESRGLRGRAYVDEDGRRGGFEIGNTWMASTAQLFRSLGFDTSHNTARATFQLTDRFDAPVLYAGWYAADCDGPFTLPGFRFPDGAIAAHLHSFSASTIRSRSRGWVGPLVDRGVACTFGNVAEPYLRLTHQFDAFFKALSRGWNFADAAYFALPGLSWQGVAIGDPLYRPFAVDLETQLDSAGRTLSVLQDQYLFIRQANLMHQSGNIEEAKRIASQGMLKSPGPALALKRASFYSEEGNRERALTSLSFTVDLPISSVTALGLWAEIGITLAELGDPNSGVKVFQKLAKFKVPENVQLAFLKKGVNVAQKSGNPGLAVEWQASADSPQPTNDNPEPIKIN